MLVDTDDAEEGGDQTVHVLELHLSTFCLPHRRPIQDTPRSRKIHPDQIGT